MSDIYKKFVANRIVRRKQVLEHFSGDTEKANAALRWLVSNGKAQRIITGLFYFKQPDEWYVKDVVVSPWLIAANSIEGSVIGYHSALRLFGYAYSEVKDIQIVISADHSRAPKGFTYQNINYTYSRNDLSYGVTEQIVSGQKVRSFDKERLILEGLMSPDKFYGMSEFLQSITDVVWLDLDHLFDMLERYTIVSLSMRLGWLLEKYKQKWHVSDDYLNQLKIYRPEDRVFFVSRRRKGNVLNKKWNIMVPKDLLNL